MKSAFVLACLFAAGGLYNVFGSEPDPTEAMAGFAISGILLLLFSSTRNQGSRDEELLAWLATNAAAIRGGGAPYHGTVIRPDTRLVAYHAVLSFLIVTFKTPSRLYIAGAERSFLIGALFTVLSFLFGWWGIPWGPIYTVQALFGNLRGGKRVTVGELIADA